MPSEITLGENMRVRCRGHVLRVVKPAQASPDSTPSAEAKIGVAVRLEGYEYLSEMTEASNSFPRVSTLHSQPEPAR
jgi:hypothetical protein